MVHALKAIWRVLVPDGRLLDLRPLCGAWPLEIVNGENVISVGPVDDSPGLETDAVANAAIAAVAQEGWYALERRELFHLYYYWETLDEMQAYVEAWWTPDVILPEALLAAAHRQLPAAGAQVRIRLDMLLSRYRKLLRE